MDYVDYNFGQVIKNLPSKSCKILEIGPGMGEGVAYLNGRGFRNIDIVDNDKNVLAVVADRFDVDKKYCVDDLTAIDDKAGKYDLVILIQVLEHLPLDQQAKIVGMLFSHLTKNGVMIIVVPNANNPLGMTERYGDLQHQNSFTQQSLVDLVENSKVKNCDYKITGFEIPPYSVLNLIRIVLQKLLHFVLFLIMIINGGVYFRIMTPNAVLRLHKRN